jgi:hypothetical protein
MSSRNQKFENRNARCVKGQRSAVILQQNPIRCHPDPLQAERDLLFLSRSRFLGSTNGVAPRNDYHSVSLFL